MKKWQRRVLWICGGVALVAALVAMIAPSVIRSQAVKHVEAATGRKLTIGRVFVNPFTLTAGADGVTLAEKGSSIPFVSFSSARVSLSPRSIYRGAPIVSSLKLVSPSVSIVRSARNTYNFSDLLEKKAESPPDDKKEPAEFCINNISISRGTVVFRDRALSAEKVHTVSDLTLDVPFISTISHLADNYISPQFSAVINGAPLRLDGKLKKGPASAEVLMSLNLKELSLPWYMPYLPANVRWSVASGTLSAAAGVTYRMSAGAAPQLMVTGTATLADVSVKEKEGAPLFSLKTGSVTVKEADPLVQKYDVALLDLDGLQVNLERDRQGSWNLSRLASAAPSPRAKAAEAKKGKTPVVHLGSAILRNGRLLFTDRKPAQAFSTVLDAIAIDVKGYMSDGNAPAQFALSFATEREEKLALKGTQTSVPPAVVSFISISGLSLASYHPYLSEWLTAPLTGKVGIDGELAYSPDKGFRIEKTNIAATSLAATFGADEGVKIARLSLDGGSLDLQERRLKIGRIGIGGSDLRFSRDAQGRLSPLTLIREQPGRNGAPAPAHTPEKGPFVWNIDSIAGDNMKFSFVDGATEDEPEFELRKMSMSLKNLDSYGRGPVPFKLAATYGDNGDLAASGSLALRPAAVRGTFRLKKIPLTDFDYYLPENLNITLADGSIDAAGRVDLVRKGVVWSGSFGGDVGVRSFYCLDGEDDDLLKWESLQLERITGTLSPFALAIDDVALNQYFAKIIIEKDGTLNLQHLMGTEQEHAGEGAAPAPVPPPGDQNQAQGQAPPEPSSQKNIRIGEVVLQDGLLNFTDNHLDPSYSTTFYNLGGRVSGLSSEESRFADVDLRGNLENQSPLQITGQINPLRDDLFVNLTMRFSDIELSPLSPYSSTYLGYLIDKGKLFLDLKYHIEKKKLESQNTVFLDQLTLGEKVDSPRATSLPVRLAIALLKDRKGEIHLDLPVSGRTDDPRFSVWGVVLKMLKNLAVKAATAPFALLTSVFGGSDEDMGGVQFAPGASTLASDEQEKLLKLANALKDRPALKMEMTGFVDRETDPEGLRRELLERKIRMEKFLEMVKEKKTQPGDSPETVRVAAEEYPKYLEMVYRKEKFPKPRTILGLVKDLPQEEMKKLILTNTVIGTRELQALATERTTAVRDFLVQRGGVDVGRLFQKSGDIFKTPAGKEEPGARVEFGMAAE